MFCSTFRAQQQAYPGYDIYGQPLPEGGAYGAAPAAEAAPYAAAAAPEEEAVTTGSVFKRDDERLSRLRETVRGYYDLA